MNKIQELRTKKSEISLGGGQSRIDKQHAAGRLTARERVAKLLDHQSFQEFSMFAQHRCTLFGMAGKEAPRTGSLLELERSVDDTSTSQVKISLCSAARQAKSIAIRSSSPCETLSKLAPLSFLLMTPVGRGFKRALIP